MRGQNKLSLLEKIKHHGHKHDYDDCGYDVVSQWKSTFWHHHQHVQFNVQFFSYLLLVQSSSVPIKILSVPDLNKWQVCRVKHGLIKSHLSSWGVRFFFNPVKKTKQIKPHPIKASRVAYVSLNRAPTGKPVGQLWAHDSFTTWQNVLLLENCKFTLNKVTFPCHLTFSVSFSMWP